MASSRLSAGEIPPAPEGTFSVVVIPDTQHYHGRGAKGEPDNKEPVTNEVFAAYVEWVVDNLQRQRIAFVSHVGDIVDINHVDQWRVARQCMDRLHGRVPYGISVGNHDMASDGDSTLFQRFFGQARFRRFAWYGGCYTPDSASVRISGNNANSYQLFTAEQIPWLWLHLECNAPDKVLKWADGVLEAHADRRAIVTTHMGLGPLNKPKKSSDYFDAPKGRMTWSKRHGELGNSPRQMWEKCFSRHANVVMICCGDQSRTQAMHMTSRGEQGNRIQEILSDYGAEGLRVMRFAPSRDVVEVRTWNPIRGALCEGTEIAPDREQHQFELPLSMRREFAAGR